MIRKLAQILYGSSVKRRNKQFDSDRIPLIRCTSHVVSIGNLSVGGTGKTPFSIYLGNFLDSQSIKTAIVGLGYKRKSKGNLVVSDGTNVLVDAEMAGDEMYLIAKKTNLPVVVSNQKSIAAKYADDRFHPDCIIVDDGFQHRKLYRDLDIVIIDRLTISNHQLIPLGILREPIEGLRRADVIALSGISKPEFEESMGKLDLSDKLIIEIFHRVGDAISIQKEIVDLKDRDIISFCGIANPKRFEDSLKALNCKVISNLIYPDHHKYSNSEITEIIEIATTSGVKLVVTTEKDIVKLGNFETQFEDAGLNLVSLEIITEIINGKEDLESLIINGIKNKKTRLNPL